MQSIQGGLLLFEADRKLSPVLVQHVVVNIRKMQLLSAVLSISCFLAVAVDSAAASGTVGGFSLGVGGGAQELFWSVTLPAETAI